MQAKKKKNNLKKFRRFWKTDRAILMSCIGIAFVFWLFTKLSYEYKSTMSITLNYELPEGRVLTVPPPNVIDMDVEGTGWDLLGSWFSSRSFDISVDLQNNAAKTLNAMTLKSKIAKQLSDKLRILELRPDFIQLLPEAEASKLVPVILDNQLELNPQYQYQDSISIEPALVKISGPASVIADLKFCKTVPLIRQKVNESFEVEVALKTHSNSNVSFEPEKVLIKAKVEEVTEKRLEVEIEKRGLPDSLLLVLLPKKIDIACIVGLSDYEALSASDFSAVVDFTDYDLYHEQNIKVVLERFPSYVRNIQFQPSKVDYIIRSQKLNPDSSSTGGLNSLK